jgi:hypothetical protein
MRRRRLGEARQHDSLDADRRSSFSVLITAEQRSSGIAPPV